MSKVRNYRRFESACCRTTGDRQIALDLTRAVRLEHSRVTRYSLDDGVRRQGSESHLTVSLFMSGVHISQWISDIFSAYS